MKPETKRALKLIGLFIPCFVVAVILLAPLCIPFLVSLTSRPYRIAKQQEAARLIVEFHERFNAHDSEGICREIYKCSELPNVNHDLQFVLEDTRNRGGAFKEVLSSDIKVFIEPPLVRADVVSLFEKGKLIEVFDFKGFDGPLKIASYKTVINEMNGSAK